MYVYHLKQNGFIGTQLLSLNELRLISSELFDKFSEKYSWRPKLKQAQVPILNCLWNDVIHLSPMPMQIIFDEAMRVGHILPNRYAFKIPIRELDATQLVEVQTYPYLSDLDYNIPPESTQKVVTESFESLEEIPFHLTKYYESCKANNIAPLLFNGLPHILFKGKIDLSSVETIQVKGNKTGQW